MIDRNAAGLGTILDCRHKQAGIIEQLNISGVTRNSGTLDKYPSPPYPLPFRSSPLTVLPLYPPHCYATGKHSSNRLDNHND